MNTHKRKGSSILGTHLNNSWHTYEYSHLWHTDEYSHMNTHSWHTCILTFMAHIWILTSVRAHQNLVAPMWSERQTRHSPVSTSHGMRMNESWHTYQWVMAHIAMSPDTHINACRQTRHSTVSMSHVTACVWMSHVHRINQSYVPRIIASWHTF